MFAVGMTHQDVQSGDGLGCEACMQLEGGLQEDGPGLGVAGTKVHKRVLSVHARRPGSMCARGE